MRAKEKMDDIILDLDFLDDIPELVDVETEKISQKSLPKERVVDETKQLNPKKRKRKLKRTDSSTSISLSDQETLDKALSSEVEDDMFFGHGSASIDFMEECSLRVSEILKKEKKMNERKQPSKSNGKRVISEDEGDAEQINNNDVEHDTKAEANKYPFAELFDHLDNEVLKSSKFVVPRKFRCSKELRPKLSKNRIQVNSNAITHLFSDIDKELTNIHPALKARNKGEIIKLCERIVTTVVGTRDQIKLDFAYKYLGEILKEVQSHL